MNIVFVTAISQFSLDKIKIMEKELLKTIHDKHGPIYDNDTEGGDFEKGFMSNYVARVLKTSEDVSVPNSRCIVMK